MTWISGKVVEREDKDEFSELTVEAIGNRYQATVRTAEANQIGYKVGVAAIVDVRDVGAKAVAIVRLPT